MSEQIMKALDSVEAKLTAMSTKADAEAQANGKVSIDTKAALDNIGTTQREFADRLVSLEQKGSAQHEGETVVSGWGAQFTKSASYTDFQNGSTQKARFEVKNTLVGADANVAPDRKPGIVPGAANILTIESLYSSIPTSSNAIEYTREASFTNAAAEAAEGSLKAESSLTWSLVNMPVATVAHFIKISRQLAGDNAALAAYVDARMVFGVQRRIESGLVTGTGVAPILSGFMAAGNSTLHGIANAALGTVLKKLVLIRMVIGNLEVAGYTPSAIVLNPADWAGIENDLLVAVSNANRVTYDMAGNPRLFGVPVVKSVGMTAGSFAVGDFTNHGNIHNREGVVVQLSESDGDNFQRNLITLRAERRLCLTSEVPAAIIQGVLVPA